MKGVWKCVSTTPGAQSVMTSGILPMQWLLADRPDSKPQELLHCLFQGLGKALIPSCWMTSAALEPRVD